MDMRRIAMMGLMTIVLAAAGTTRAQASGCEEGKDCKPETRDVCFNLVCFYHGKDVKDHGFKECKAASTFVKKVTVDGGEVADDGDRDRDDDKRRNPTLEITCDDDPRPVYNNSAYRSTDLLGTVIQGQSGPNPSITLPRGELHTGSDNNLGGNHQSPSELTIEFGTAHDDHEHMKGECTIWTGNP